MARLSRAKRTSQVGKRFGKCGIGAGDARIDMDDDRCPLGGQMACDFGRTVERVVDTA